MATEETLFDLPNTPDEFGVILPSPNLRKLDFTGLDYTTAQRAIVEYIKTYYPDTFNDWVASNALVMMIDIIAGVVSKIALRSDMLAGEATLPTAQTEEAVVNHLALINQRIKRQTPAITDVEITVDQPLFSDLEIAGGTSFQVTAPDGTEIIYEIFRAPRDWTSKIVIPAGKRGTIAYGLEGRFATPVVVTSSGGSNQIQTIQDADILESPIFVTVETGGEEEEWTVITEPLERYGPTDKVVEVNFIDDKAIFRFGDDVTGAAPRSGATITFSYRVGGGIRGRLGVGLIDTVRQMTPQPPANASVSVRFRNVSPSVGGTDRETVAQAKKRAPRDFATQRSIISGEDYAQAASNFSHPVFGAVSKAMATTRTSKNANLVEIYALADGPDGLPIAPNAGLKAGLTTHFSDLNVLTDQVVVLDGTIKPIDVEMTVVMNRNADASVVKERVETALTNYFKIDNWEMGHPFYLSHFMEAIKSIDGVTYIDVHSPVDNVLPTGKEGDPNSAGVGFNELIVEGARNVSYYYEKNPPPAGIRAGR
jgi:hypothetical protein